VVSLGWWIASFEGVGAPVGSADSLLIITGSEEASSEKALVVRRLTPITKPPNM
jgi:hypothetical protein